MTSAMSLGKIDNLSFFQVEKEITLLVLFIDVNNNPLHTYY